MKIWGGMGGHLEAPQGKCVSGIAFPGVSPKRGMWGNVSPSRKHGGARGRVSQSFPQKGDVGKRFPIPKAWGSEGARSPP